MAGSDGFQRELNRSAQPTGTEGSSVTGDFSTQPIEGSNQVGGTTGASGSFDYSMLDTAQDVDKPSSIQGPGSFGKQIEREKYLADNDIAQGTDGGDFVMKYANMNKQLQSGDANDGSSIANKYIQNAARTNPINIEALDRSIRQRPLYHEAKSKLEGLKTFGDTARWSREQLPDFKLPEPMEGVDAPDFEGMYNRSKKDLDSLEI
tara:strand:+ start:108 stop:725 length:618 start_codon:yes stop_codon:yes gene_type:complete